MIKNKIINGTLLGICGAVLFSSSSTLAFNNEFLNLSLSQEEQEATNAVTQAESSKSTSDIESARVLVNALPEGGTKDGLQTKLNNITEISDLTLTKLNSTSNVDVYIKSENMLSINLSTNNITFEDFSGVAPIEKTNALNITVNSSLPYELNAYLPNDIQNATKDAVIPKETLKIKESSESGYKEFTALNTKLTLKDNNPAGNDKVHTIDLKLDTNLAHKADVYKATVKFEAQQK